MEGEQFVVERDDPQEADEVTERPMSDFEPYANEGDAPAIGHLAIENRVDRITVHNDVALTKDKDGLAQACALKTVVDAGVKTLEAEKYPPDIVQVMRARTVKNPFG